MSTVETRPISSSEAEQLATQIAKKFLDIVGRTRLSVDTVQLFTALLVRQIGKGVWVTAPTFVPPLTTLKVVNVVPQDQVHALFEVRITAEQDHAIAYSLVIDGGKYVITDPDVVMARYTAPIDFITHIGALIAGERTFEFTIQNYTQTTQYFSVAYAEGIMERPFWDALYNKFYGVIAREVGIER
jgi:hypothetical protein